MSCTDLHLNLDFIIRLSFPVHVDSSVLFFMVVESKEGSQMNETSYLYNAFV